MKIIFICSCSGIFRDVQECSGMFRNVPAFIDAPVCKPILDVSVIGSVIWCVFRQGMLEERINCTLSSLLRELAEEE